MYAFLEMFCAGSLAKGMDMIMKQEFLQVGRLTKTHGIMGELRLEPWADSPEFLLQFQTLYVGDTHWPIEVLGARVHNNMVILKLNGITDVNGALAMRGQVLSIRREDAPLPMGSFYLADLIGLQVRDAENGAVLGTLSKVLPLPAQNVYVVQDGQREFMVPAVPEFIVETNIDEGYLRVHVIEGL